jgi:uncharacterized protein
MYWSRLKRWSVALLIALCVWGLLRSTGMNTGMSIWTAVRKEDLAAIQRYADRGGNLELGSFFWAQTPLFYALKSEKKESYRKLLEVGASPNTLCRRGNVVIHFAAAEEDTYWLRLALDSGGNPNLFNKYGYGWITTTPIGFAVSAGRLNNVKLLCERGADINAMDAQKRTPLTNACGQTRFEIVHYLLEKGADYNKPAPETFTFIFSLQEKPPEAYHRVPDDTEKWCRVVWDWMISHGADPRTAIWNGTEWKFAANREGAPGPRVDNQTEQPMNPARR